MARITRNKAAEILGLSRQTISNYIEQGLIGSCVGEHGILYVNSEDVERNTPRSTRCLQSTKR